MDKQIVDQTIERLVARVEMACCFKGYVEFSVVRIEDTHMAYSPSFSIERTECGALSFNSAMRNVSYGINVVAIDVAIPGFSNGVSF
jgi:hypothetical protein